MDPKNVAMRQLKAHPGRTVLVAADSGAPVLAEAATRWATTAPEGTRMKVLIGVVFDQAHLPGVKALASPLPELRMEMN